MHRGRILTLVLLFTTAAVGAANVASAQETGKRISIRLENVSVLDALREINQLSGNVVVFRSEEVEKESKRVSLDMQDAPVADVVKAALKGTSLNLIERDGRIVVVPQQLENVKITGTVRDEDNQPLPGVAVLIKGTTVGTATDINGEYALNLPTGNHTLVFSMLGMKKQEVGYTGQKVLSIKLEKAITLVDEVVVTGYSTRKVSELTGSMQSFKGEDVKKWSTGGNVMNALRGHTTGLQITGSSGAPGSDGAPLLRGKGTIYTDNTLGSDPTRPLIVIDGVVTDYTDLNDAVSASDIEEITVLKDAASTAIYGSRAATGVIVVTTKKGVKDKMTISLDVKTGINIPNFGGLRYMTSPELLEFGQMTLRNWWNDNENLQASYSSREKFLQDTLGTLLKNFDLTQTTDWKDLVYQNGLSEDVALSFRGGNQNMRYYFSYN